MKKILSLIIVMLFLINAAAITCFAVEVSAPSAILIEASSRRVLFEKDSDIPMPPASVTKVMTMLLVMEAIEKGQIAMDDMVRCSENAASMGGSQVYLEPNEEMSVADMLKAVAVASGNDAAVALAEFVAGSEAGFIDMMNKKAEELGLSNTVFKNCNGLPIEGHHSSARDIAIMSAALLEYPQILEFTSIWMDSLRGGEFGLVNTNKLIRFYEGANGLKTGSTGEAKYCLSASAKRDGMQLIAVVLGAENSKKRFQDASSMLDYGFNTFAIANSLISQEELGTVKVLKGKTEFCEAFVDPNVNVLVEKAKMSDIEKKVTMEDVIKAPVTEGEKLGEVEFILNGEVLAKADILSKFRIEKITPADVFMRFLGSFLCGNEKI